MFDAFMSCFIIVVVVTLSSLFSPLLVVLRFSRPRPFRIIVVVVVVKTRRDDLDDDDECDDDRLSLDQGRARAQARRHRYSNLVALSVVVSPNVLILLKVSSNAHLKSLALRHVGQKRRGNLARRRRSFSSRRRIRRKPRVRVSFCFLHIVIISSKDSILVSGKKIEFSPLSLSLFSRRSREGVPSLVDFRSRSFAFALFRVNSRS